MTIVLAITGASGAAYAVRLLDVLLNAGRDVHLSISPAGKAVLEHELGLKVDLDVFRESDLLAGRPDRLPRAEIHYHHYQDLMAPIASGSFLTAGMVVCPCSGGGRNSGEQVGQYSNSRGRCTLRVAYFRSRSGHISFTRCTTPA